MQRLVCGILFGFSINAASAANIPDTLAADGRFTALLAAAKAAGANVALAGPGPFTLFAPTDAAFAKLPPGKLDGLLTPASQTELLKTLGLHRVDGRVGAADWDKRTITTKSAAGIPLVIADVGGQVTVNGVAMGPAIVAENGVIYPLAAVVTLPVPVAAHSGR